MSIVDLLQKGMYKDPTVQSSYETLKMATINAAKALGLDKEIGSIEVGKKADIVVLDLEHTTTLPINDLIVDIVHNVHSNNINMTMINGEIIYRDNMLFLPFMEMELRDRVNAILRRIG